MEILIQHPKMNNLFQPLLLKCNSPLSNIQCDMYSTCQLHLEPGFQCTANQMKECCGESQQDGQE